MCPVHLSSTNPVEIAPRLRRKDERPAELLQAALTLFSTQGYAATRMLDIATLAGVSKGTLFRYYASKQALFEAVIRHYMANRIRIKGAELERQTGPAASLLKEALLKGWSLFNNAQIKGLPRLVVCEAPHQPDLVRLYLKEVVQPGQKLLAKILERGIASGEFRAISIPTTVQSLWSAITYLLIWEQTFEPYLGKNKIDPVTFIEHHVNSLCHGLTPPTQRGSN